MSGSMGGVGDKVTSKVVGRGVVLTGGHLAEGLGSAVISLSPQYVTTGDILGRAGWEGIFREKLLFNDLDLRLLDRR